MKKSRAGLQDLEALGTRVDLITGDVAIPDDVRSAFEKSMKPIARDYTSGHGLNE